MADVALIPSPARRPARRVAGGAGRLLLLGLALLAVLLAGCTDEESAEEEPGPPPAEEDDEGSGSPIGYDVAVVTSPRTSLSGGVLEGITNDLARLEEAHPDDLRQLRPVIPDGPAFVGDLAELVVREGADLTCVMGSVGRRLTSELRELHPYRRFCALTPNDPPEEPEEGVDVIALRTVELGHLVGAGIVPLAAGGDVALALGPSELQRGPFMEGLQAGLGNLETVEVDPEPSIEEAVAELAADGVTVLVVGTQPEAGDYLAAGIDNGLAVVTHAGNVGGDVEVALVWDLYWDRILQPAIDRLLGVVEPAPLSLGLEDGVFDALPGVAAPRLLQQVLDGIRHELITGERDPFEPVEDPDEDDEDVDEEPAEEDEEEPADEEPTGEE